MLNTVDSITTMIYKMLSIIFVALIITQYTGINNEYNQSLSANELSNKNKYIVNTEKSESNKGSVKSSVHYSQEGLWDFKNRILIVNIVEYNTALKVVELPEYVTEETKETILQYVYNTMECNDYGNCYIIGVLNDVKGNGTTVHFIFNDNRYVCVWFNNKSYRYITIYDKIISDLTEYSEGFIM